jgi:hypothetical protein
MDDFVALPEWSGFNRKAAYILWNLQAAGVPSLSNFSSGNQQCNA